MNEENHTEETTEDAPVLRALILTPPEDERWTAWELEMGYDN